MPITIDEAKKSALEYIKKEVPESQAELVSANLQGQKWFVEFSWSVKKTGGTQYAKVTVSESGDIEGYEKTHLAEDEKYTADDFLPLFVIVAVPSSILGITIILRPAVIDSQFGTIIFFIFLLTVLGFLFSMKWLLYGEHFDEAFGLPQGSIRTVIALTVIFFALFVGIFGLKIPSDIVTLLASLVAFYFGATTAKSKSEETQKPKNDSTTSASNQPSPSPAS